jgi:PPP family 3-phenylpropionic acid transporter
MIEKNTKNTGAQNIVNTNGAVKTAGETTGKTSGQTPAKTPEKTSRETPSVRLAGFYLAYFAVMGVVVPYWSPYLRSLGFSAAQIGELMAVFMAARIIAPLLMGALADKTGRPMLMVRIAAGLAALCFVYVFVDRSYFALAITTAAFGLFYASGLPAFEAVTLNHLGGRDEHYGRIRLWGSWGFIFSVVGIGYFLDWTSVAWVPHILQGLFVLLAVLGLGVPRAPPRVDGADSPSFLHLLKDKRVLALLAVGVLNQMGHGPYYVFFSIRLQDVGYPESVIGPLWAVGVLAEILIFFLMARLLPRFGPRRLLLAALALTVVRWNGIALFVEHPLLLIPIQTLHAASYGIFHAVTIHLIHKMFVGRTQSRGQALYAAFGFGVGGALGSLYSGYAWTALGPVLTYQIASGLPALALLVAFMWVREPPPGKTLEKR